MLRVAPRSVFSRTAAACLLAATVLAGCGTRDGLPRWGVRSRTVSGLGPVLEDGAGYTLYVYVPDNQGPSKCYEACARAWPPLVLPKGVAVAVGGAGVKASLLGTSRRRDGDLQVTYNHWPLYTYVDDARGEVNGQGEGMGAWYTLSVTGVVDRQQL